ncbi:MAG: Rab family GTPase [Candidatus Hodarchaeales archaeon]|jgi:small GTP-binding protein
MTNKQLVRPNNYKIAILGEGGIGKTTLCKTYDRKQTYLDTMQTIAVEFHVIKRSFCGVEYTLQVWDLGGQKHFRDMGVFEKYCKGVYGVVVCFDLTDMETLFIVPRWLTFIPEKVPVILVGTKADLSDSDDFVLEEIQHLIDNYRISDYVETSAMDIESVEKVFSRLLSRIIESETVQIFKTGAPFVFK